jgi:hypothetical protein
MRSLFEVFSFYSFGNLELIIFELPPLNQRFEAGDSDFGTGPSCLQRVWDLSSPLSSRAPLSDGPWLLRQR